MDVLREYFNLGVGALFFKVETYQKMRDEARPMRTGLTLIVLVGVIVAALALVGTALEWSTTPDMDKVKPIVLEELATTSWYQEMAGDPVAIEGFQETFDRIWEIAIPLAAPNILNAALNILLMPLMLIIQWLVYGALAFLFARLLGGKAGFAQTLGCLALAVAPQMLGAIQVVPNAQAAGLFAWTLVCSYLGLKVSGQLSPWRAFWATILPMIVLAILMLIGGAVAFSAIGASTGGA